MAVGSAPGRDKQTGPRVTRVRPAGPNHQVVTVEGGRGKHCSRPCADCPWRRDAIGEFPAAAFIHSAPTAYDMADRTFGCHAAGSASPRPCAGFLLRGADHNLSVRLMAMRGELGSVEDGGHELFDSYREMAIANGVAPDHPALEKCR